MKLSNDLLRPLEEIRRVTGKSALTNLAEAVLADLGHPHFKLPAQDTDEGLLTREALAAYRAAVTREAPFQDILGPVHQTQLTGQTQKQRTGQFFTPWSLAQVMVKMQLTGWTPGPAGPPESGRFLWTVNEPALGCGGLLLAFCAEVLEAHGPDGLNWWSCSGVDIDREVTIAAAAQFCMNMEVHQLQLGELVIAHGNTLSCECFGFYLHLYYPGLPLQLLTPFVPTPQGPAPIWLVRPPTGAAAEEPAFPAEEPAPAAGPDELTLLPGFVSAESPEAPLPARGRHGPRRRDPAAAAPVAEPARAEPAPAAESTPAEPTTRGRMQSTQLRLFDAA